MKWKKLLKTHLECFDEKGAHYILVVCVLLFGTGLYSLNADYLIFTSEVPELTELEPQVVLEGDSLDPRYPVAKTVPEAYDDLIKNLPWICVIRTM